MNKEEKTNIMITPNTKSITVNGEVFYLADLSKRYKAQIIDSFVVIVFILIAALIFSASAVLGGFFLKASIILGILYILFADGMHNGQSIGKLYTGTKTINSKTGKPCTYLQSFVRNIFYSIEILDYIFILGDKRQRLGEKVARTYVVYSDDKPVTWLQKFIAQRKQKRLDEEARHRQMTSGQVFFSWVKTLAGAIVVVTIINGLALASFVVPTGSMENTVLTGEYLFVNKFIFGPSTPQIIPIINLPLPYYKTPPLRDPKQGDIIVFIFPGEREQVKSKEFTYYLKRCIAVSGDTIQVKNDSVYVNGVQFHLPEKGKYDEMAHGGLPPESIAAQESMRTFPEGLGYTASNYGPLRIPKKGDVLQLSRENIRQWKVFIRREGHNVNEREGNITIDGKIATSYTVERDYVFGMGDNRWNSLDSRFWGFIPKQDVVGTPMMVYWSMETQDTYGNEYSFLQRLAHIRWSRLGTIINN